MVQMAMGETTARMRVEALQNLVKYIKNNLDLYEGMWLQWHSRHYNLIIFTGI
jgi:hypothetical protein